MAGEAYSPINTWDDRQGVGAVKEDIYDMIINIDPTEYQLQAGLGTVPVKSVKHEWAFTTLAAGNTVFKNIEGFTPGYADVTAVTRAYNMCQNISAEVKVTDTERITDTVGMADRLAHEKSKAIDVLKNRIEYSLMAGALATGNATTARGMAGIKDTGFWKDFTNHAILTTSPSGVSLSETMFNDYLANVYDASQMKATEAYMGSVLKRRISGFTAGATKNIKSEDKRLVNAVDVYESDFGIVKLFLHRYGDGGATADKDLTLINPSVLKVGFLKRPEYTEAAKTGSFTAGWYETEVTLQMDDPRAVHVARRLK